MKLVPHPFISSSIALPLERTSQPAHVPGFPRQGQPTTAKTRSRTCPPALCPEKRPDFRQALLRHAQREAQALAASTPYPDLFLTCLVEEKLDQAKRYTQRQERLWDQSKDILTRVA